MPEPLRVLLLEDREDDAAMIVFALQQAGFAPDWRRVQNAEAFAAALEPSLDLILADYRLPDWNGLEALDTFLASGLDIPFILISGTIGEEVAVEAMRHGASDYLIKDRLTRLGPAVRQQLERKRLRAERRAEEAARAEEKRIAEEVLRESEARYRDLIENSSDIIQSLAPDGRFQYVNKAWHEALGYDEADLARLTIFDIVSDGARAHCLATFAAVLSGDTLDTIETEFITKDGARIAVEGKVNCRTENGMAVAARCIFRDVTERKRADTALREASTLRRIAGATARIGGWRITLPADTLIFSDEICDILELPHGTAPRLQEAFPFHDESGSESFQTAYDACRTDGTAFDLELELVTAGERRLWGRCIGEAERNAAGAIVAVQGSLQDITVHREAEAALRASEQQYRLLVENAEEVIFSLAPDAMITSVNPAFERLSGWPANEWIGRSFWDLIDERDRDSLQRSWSGVFAGMAAAPSYVRVQTRDEARTIYASASPGMREGKLVQITGIARDVTDEWRARQERDELTARLRLVLESIDEGLYVLDAKGRCGMINRSGAELLGYAPEELLGRTIEPLIRHSGGVSECPAAIVIATGRTVRSSNEVLWRKDGTWFPVEMACSPIFDGDRVSGSVVTFADITKRIAVERQLEQARRVETLGRLATIMAHEFNNVLMGIQPFAEIIARNPPGEVVASATARIQDGVRRGKTITQDILRFSRPSNPSLESVAVAAWLRDLAADARVLLPESVELVVEDVPQDLELMTDARLLHQAFVNMVLNSRDAMPEGGRLTISARAGDDCSNYPAAAIDDPEKYVRLTVADTGCGILREVADHIFEPLFTTKRTGTGIGLAVTHQIIQSHGGKVFVESEPGKGTRLHVFIPCAPQGEATLPVAAAPSPEAAPPMRVLLVEDDPAVAAGISTLLEMAGMQVEAVDCGARALAEVRRFQPVAVVLDVGLPDMDGEVVYEQIAGEWPELPVIFSTGHADQARLQHLLDRGNVACLTKPYEIGALLDVLARLAARPAPEAR